LSIDGISLPKENSHRYTLWRGTLRPVKKILRGKVSQKLNFMGHEPVYDVIVRAVRSKQKVIFV
jgi:hypothetical protein